VILARLRFHFTYTRQVADDSWPALLRSINDRLIGYLETEGPVIDDDKKLLRTRWLGNPPASEEAIAAAERRLGVKLPAAYREFLAASNGWRTCLEFPHGICDLVPIEELRRFTEVDARRGAWDGYLRDLAAHPMTEDWQGPVSEIEDSLAIGDGDGNEYILLCPSAGGKVWTYHNECGFEAYASFLELMQEGLKWKAVW